MKSFYNSMVFGLALGLLAVALTGCGDDDSAGASGGASCAQVCAKVEAAKCENDPDCMSTCKTVKDSTPMGCTGTYSALANCYAGAKFTCDGDDESVAKECTKQESAYAECVQSGGKDDGAKDAGDGDDNGDNGDNGAASGDNGGSGAADGDGAGSGGSDDSAGNAGNGGSSGGTSCGGVAVEGECGQCLQGSCCDELLACQGEADCRTLTDCVGDCSDSSCIQACADSASSSAVDIYNTFIDCATGQCESECSDGSSSGGSDVGAANDGDGGHASATTPTDCLEVPSDVTGYCEEVKYKVIYDCPNGAPYDDCELNKVGAGGIYCCGH